MKFLTPEEKSMRRGECAVTGRDSDPVGMFLVHNKLKQLTPAGLMDTDIDVFVCAAAVGEMARQLGWHSPDDIAELQAAFDSQTDEFNDIKKRLEKIEQIKELEAELEEVAA